jgi:hypothetical protein
MESIVKCFFIGNQKVVWFRTGALDRDILTITCPNYTCSNRSRAATQTLIYRESPQDFELY